MTLNMMIMMAVAAAVTMMVMMIVVLTNIMVIKLGMMMLITVILKILVVIRHAFRAQVASRKPRYVGFRVLRKKVPSKKMHIHVTAPPLPPIQS